MANVLPTGDDLTEAREVVDLLTGMMRAGQGAGVLEALQQMSQDQVAAFAFYLLTEASKNG